MAGLQSFLKAMIWGHTVGDALGVTVEFESRETLANNPVADMVT